MRRIFWTISLVLSVLCSSAAAEQLRSGWYILDPFQYVDDKSGQAVLTGLDVELLRVIAREAGEDIRFEEKQWRNQLADIASGKQDITTGATRTEQRQKFAHFSIPYRTETNVLYVPVGKVKEISATTIEELLAVLKKKGFRLGVIDGYAYASDTVNQFIDDPMNAAQIFRAQNDHENFYLMLDGQIDGFIADRIVASTVAWRNGFQQKAQEHPLTMTQDIHLMFSKETVSEEVVQRFNQAIVDLRESGEINTINKRYIFPILLSQTLDSRWFFLIDILGTFAFAVSGLLLAYKYRYDIFGAFVLASLPAIGGGVVRDLLTNRNPIGVMQDPIYLYIIMATVLSGYALLRAFDWWRHHLHHSAIYKSKGFRSFINSMVQVFDALGLAAFTVTGVVVALATKSEPLWMWGAILATLTGAGGGILRDVVRSDPDIPALKGELYPEVAFIWGLLLSLYLQWQTHKIAPDEILIGIIVTVIGVFTTRMLAVHLGWRSPRYYLKGD
jgi:polar amino acid transport system substrate-binding protein